MSVALVVTAVTIIISLVLLLVKTKQRLSYVLPLVAFAPVVIAYLGYKTPARITAYVLVGLTVFLELLRVTRPSFNRRLARFSPELFSEREIVRPLGVSGAIAIIAILLHLEPVPTLVAAAGFGILAVSVAKALQTRWPIGRAPLWRTTSRGLALYLVLAMLAVLPAVALLSGYAVGTLLLCLVVAWAVALVPLPVDRYVLTPLSVAFILFVVS